MGVRGCEGAYVFVWAVVVDVHVLAFRHCKSSVAYISRLRGEGVTLTAEANKPDTPRRRPPPPPLHTMATTTTTTTATTTPVVEEGKLLSESLATVKIQVGQMKRHLVRLAPRCLVKSCADVVLAGQRRNHGRAQKRQSHARRTAHLVPLPKAILRALCVSPASSSSFLTSNARHGRFRCPPSSLQLPLRRTHPVPAPSRRSLRARPIRRKHRPPSLPHDHRRLRIHVYPRCTRKGNHEGHDGDEQGRAQPHTRVVPTTLSQWSDQGLLARWDRSRVSSSPRVTSCPFTLPTQSPRRPPGLDFVRPHQLYRDEQALGASPTSRSLARPREARNGTSRTAYTRRHQSRPSLPARWRRFGHVPDQYTSRDIAAGRQLQGRHCPRVLDGGRHPGTCLAVRGLTR